MKKDCRSGGEPVKAAPPNPLYLFRPYSISLARRISEPDLHFTWMEETVALLGFVFCGLEMQRSSFRQTAMTATRMS